MAFLTNCSRTDPMGHRVIRGRASRSSLTVHMDRRAIRGRALCYSNTGRIRHQMIRQSDLGLSLSSLEFDAIGRQASFAGAR
jgi:hypothetical protein